MLCRQDAFTLDVLEVPQGSGSGFVWDKSGHIVTNFHVIRGASDLRLVQRGQGWTLFYYYVSLDRLCLAQSVSTLLEVKVAEISVKYALDFQCNFKWTEGVKGLRDCKCCC